MADHEQENAREQLTEREREALRILASEIVREAMAQEQTPEQKQEQAWIEGEKLEHETSKTQVLITVALLGASGAAWFIQDPKHVWLLGFAVTFGITSLGFALNHMFGIANALKHLSDPTPGHPALREFFTQSASIWSGILFVGATFFLTAYLIYNI